MKSQSSKVEKFIKIYQSHEVSGISGFLKKNDEDTIVGSRMI